jgi:2,4-dienoyl-CoA reductase-like NADH-dependent reductase (Old Yellow Enzyme family)
MATPGAAVCEAGVDGAEIHGAHGCDHPVPLAALQYPDDEYGGDFGAGSPPLGIIEAIRREAGQD